MKDQVCGWRAKIGVLTPPNYCIISEWGEVIPEGVAKTVTKASEIPEAGSLIRTDNGPSFVLLKVKPGDPPKAKRSTDAAGIKHRFRQAITEA